MKINIFLSVVSVFTVFHLCKAGPLRHLEKRAAFYIANETACVVDNIVYSNGDPIPTDDPCEACRCRPPGFACVLKECKIKPGCRAVRHVGQCCPEYICGCEHNGQFYQDGDKIKDPKNPCYECYCQGSSIACAFVDCIYQDECDSVFVPGECCPKYTNCSKGENALPPANLLPTFNEESILPEVPSTNQAVGQPEIPIYSIQPEKNNENDENTFSPETNESEDESSKSETDELGKSETDEPSKSETDELSKSGTDEPSKSETDEPSKSETDEPSKSQTDESSKSETVESESLITEAGNQGIEVEEKDTEPLESFEEKNDTPKVIEDTEKDELTEEIKVLLNSESDINKDITEDSEVQDLKLTTVEEKELPQTTVGSNSEEIVEEVEVTEKSPEIESTTSTEIAEKDPQIQNSAAENSKSLKLTDNDQGNEIEEEEDNTETDKNTVENVVTETVTESTSVVPADDLKESSTLESKTQSEESEADKSQENSDIRPFKIKSETSKTYSIIVHVKDSLKIPTETDFVAETITPVSTTIVSEKNLLNDEIVNTSNYEVLTETKDKITATNFEIFPTTTQTSKDLSKSPSTDPSTENVQGRSGDSDNTALETEENPVNEEKVPDLKIEDNSPATTTVDSIENKEVKSDEKVIEEIKVDEPKSTTVRVDASSPVTIEIITDSASSPKPDKSTTELEKTEDIIEEKEPKDEKTEDTVVAPEIRDPAAIPLENVKALFELFKKASIREEEMLTGMEKVITTTEKEITIPEKTVHEFTPTNIEEKPEIRTNDEEVTEKNEEKTITEKVEEKKGESKSEIATEKAEEKISESKSEIATEKAEEKISESKSEIATEKAEEKINESKLKIAIEKALEKISESKFEITTEKAEEKENERISEVTPENAEEKTSETKSEVTTEKAKEKTNESKPEITTEKAEEKTSESKYDVTTEKAEEKTSESKYDVTTEKAEEKTSESKYEATTEKADKTTSKSKSDATTESQNQATEEPKQTTLSDNQ